MRIILLTQPGERLPQKHARLEHERLTHYENSYIEKESAAEFAWLLARSADGRTTNGKAMVRKARKLDDEVARLKNWLIANP